MPKLWFQDPSGPAPEGKYLVVRRDGTVPPWGHMVLSFTDPATPVALMAYATAAEMLEWDPEYVASIRELAQELSENPRDPKADPDAGPHRKDLPAIIRLMRGEGDLTGLKVRDVKP